MQDQYQRNLTMDDNSYTPVPLEKYPTAQIHNAQYEPQYGTSRGSQPFVPQQQQAPPAEFDLYSNIFNDPSTKIGAAVGRNALTYGRDYVTRHIPIKVQASAFKYYFQVSNSYVLFKLYLVLFPWRHKSWARKLQRSEDSGAIDGYATARDDINAPDMYIPYLAFTTYILLNCVVAGVKGSFHPQLIQSLTSSTVAFLMVEMVLLKCGTYLLRADAVLLDFFAYSGYKFVGVIITSLVQSLFPWWRVLKWTVFLYTASSNSFFLLRSLRYVLLADNSGMMANNSQSPPTTHTINSTQRQRRIQFLFVYSFVCQFVLMWFLL